jgi:hypothetical protein
MNTGVHAVIFTTDAERDRAFFRDVLDFPSVDAGGGWLIFRLPPAELAAHPAENCGQCQLYLMCDDVEATLADLKSEGSRRRPAHQRRGLRARDRDPTAWRRRARAIPTAAPLAAVPRRVHVVTRPAHPATWDFTNVSHDQRAILSSHG